MANRAYLYSGNSELSILRDLSESRTPIPLVYKIILGCNTEITNSKIWNYEHPIAIKGDLKKGLEKLFRFYDYLIHQGFEISKIKKYKKETEDFFSTNHDRKLDLFFLECGEIFDLISDSEPLEEQNLSLFKEIEEISQDIDGLLEKRAGKITFQSEKTWLKQLKSDVDSIEPYWAKVTYYSFNNS